LTQDFEKSFVVVGFFLLHKTEGFKRLVAEVRSGRCRERLLISLFHVQHHLMRGKGISFLCSWDRYDKHGGIPRFTGFSRSNGLGLRSRRALRNRGKINDGPAGGIISAAAWPKTCSPPLSQRTAG
jgi:hypothetical protein